MAQVFSADAQSIPGPITIVTTAETQGPITNFLTIPFQNAKGFGTATVFVLPGTGSTNVTLRIRRNPNAENLVVATAVLSGGFTVGSPGSIAMPFVDPIPDNRAVQYAVTVTTGGATGNGSILAGSAIFATMISG